MHTWNFDSDHLQVYLPGVGQYQITAQSVALLQKESQNDALLLQRSLPMAAHLLLRGVAPLHAAALNTSLGAVIVAGRSASGKSTLAALLHHRSYGILADDLTGLQLERSKPVALPGYAGIVLWKDAMIALGLAVDAYQQVHLEMDKYTITTETPCTDQPVPVRAIFLLSVHQEAEVTVEAVTGMQKFQVIGHNTYNTRLTDALVSRDAFFALSAAIAASIPVWRIRRPRRIWTAEQIADRIESLLV